MKKLIRLNIEKFTEDGQDYFVATSDDIQGLVAEGRTLQEALEIAEDVAQVLLDMEKGKNASLNLKDLPSQFEYPLIMEV
ncbi:DUF1902 domain-containing protein [Nodularia spumigena CS-584]|jgi:predicted RNase H-like HicB family nuclease|uniref:DUF1902 domain-containing protein n=3 Tax=Nodularia spumigena TaxID=70799 RepID=A0A2S0Q633_NODSP|nr:DUF1902 domain-containing protein [Nodularia spumigena]AHJ27990.1 hypothetical protein NSP_16560 [Nodularia spumigena CCY9414]AVZ29818.1 hypothetical protein BMF81_00732 [Nodularia spumigena UHCC 0039]MDB9385005.1 DUF1902 domain-containing protein [Nodularia spumigena CS-584]MEA5524035.1 DUF1902 domain-containing protein [Nodularia spumigena UHCC 0143]MEA5555279.1 DUF1902 domain-containing protein [Nodularia spumigena CH309]